MSLAAGSFFSDFSSVVTSGELACSGSVPCLLTGDGKVALFPSLNSLG